MTTTPKCYRPLAETLGDAAYCNICKAERGQMCLLLLRGSDDPEIQKALERADYMIARYYGPGGEYAESDITDDR